MRQIEEGELTDASPIVVVSYLLVPSTTQLDIAIDRAASIVRAVSQRFVAIDPEDEGGRDETMTYARVKGCLVLG